VAQLAERCPEFRQEGRLVNVARCRVTESGEFARLGGDTYYYALYCVEEKDDQFLGSCADSDSVNGHNNRSNIAVFVRRSGPTLRLVTSVATIGAGNFRRPSIVVSPFGAIMELPLIIAATCDCNSSSYYLRQARAQGWQEIDFNAWKEDLAKRLPAGLTNMNSPWPDLRTLKVDGWLWRNGDAHADPTGGQWRGQLGIVDSTFVLKSLQVLPAQEAIKHEH
jgi:hypothetical protein